MALTRRKRLMLYIHIPFCAKKCNYCDFCSFNADENTIEKYVDSLINEIHIKSVLAIGLSISSIYIGGGTPSFIKEIYIEKILNAIYLDYKVEDNVEITIEANPNSLTKEKLSLYKKNGINRLSIGLQSTHNDELISLGRIHTYEDFLNAYDAALRTGFKNINIDLIYGIPHQTVDRFKESLSRVLKFKPTHISIYNLIIEEGTPFYEMKKENKLDLPPEDEVIKMDDLIDEYTDKYNYVKYEVSNFAKENFYSMHNLGYWSDVYYMGFGLNSSSYFYDLRMKNHNDINKYNDIYKMDLNFFTKEELIEYYDAKDKIYDENTDDYTISKNIKEILLKSEKFKNSFLEVLIPTKDELISEYVMMGMRKTVGISKRDFFRRFSQIFENVYYFEIKKYIENELLIKDNDYYYLSERGMALSNQVLADFMLDNDKK